MTLGGHLKHMALVEQRYAIDFTGRPPGPPLNDPAAASSPEWVWRSALDDPPEDLYALWRNAVAYARAGMTEALADDGLDQPTKFAASAAGAAPNLRRILVDLICEYARHLGHVDLFREAIDGLVGEDPPQPSADPTPSG